MDKKNRTFSPVLMRTGLLGDAIVELPSVIWLWYDRFAVWWPGG